MSYKGRLKAGLRARLPAPQAQYAVSRIHPRIIALTLPDGRGSERSCIQSRDRQGAFALTRAQCEAVFLKDRLSHYLPCAAFALSKLNLALV